MLEQGPNGKNVTDYDAVTIVNIGGGDTHRTDITIKPYRMSTTRLGDGTIDIARALVALVPKAALNDVTAQFSLVNRQSTDQRADERYYGSGRPGGQYERPGPHWGDFTRAPANPPIRHFNRGRHISPERGTHAASQGSGEGRGPGLHLIPEAFAAQLNAIGALFAVLFAAASKR